MNKINGDANVFIDCIGRRHPDNRILEAAAIVATDFSITETNYDEQITYWQFFQRGVCFAFDDTEQLNTVFIYAQNSQQYQTYPFFKDLIEGLDDSSSRQDIVKLLGFPCAYNKQYIKYYLGNKYIHFEFDTYETLALITISQSYN